jgi:hypothetical protein
MKLKLAENCRNLDGTFYGLTQKGLIHLSFLFTKMNGLRDRLKAAKK